MEKLKIYAYEWGKRYDPKSCRECTLFCRCGICIPSGEKIEEFWDSKTRPGWCPVEGENDERSNGES